MKIETYSLKSDESAVMTTYLLDSSPEFDNIDKRPAVLILPGGGYHFVSDREAEPIAMKYAAEGYHAFVLRYAVGVEKNFDMALANAEEAMKIIRENAANWSLDANKIAVIGFSAGGHLAASLSVLAEEDLRPNALLLAYPCILDSMNSILAYPVPSIDKHVHGKVPATFLFTTFEDELVPLENSLAFMQALRAANVAFESHIFQHGGHGLSLGTSYTSSGFPANVNEHFGQWFPLSVGWLKQVFGDYETNKLTVDDDSIDAYSINVSIEKLLAEPACRSIILTHLPNIESHEQFEQIKVHSLHVINQFLPKPFSEEELNDLNEQLMQVAVNK